MKEFTSDELQEIRHQAIKAIVPSLVDMSRQNLVDLVAMEADEENPRETLVDAITKQLEKIDAADTDESDAAEDAAADADAPPVWQADEYTGPLTIDQASWRRANTKPVDRVITK